MIKNKLKTLSLASVISSIIFSILCFSYHPDISLTALPFGVIYSAVLFYSGYNQLFGKKNLNHINVFRTLLQYHPYVLLIAFVLRRAGNSETLMFFDFIEVILWCVTGFIDLWILHFFNPKKLSAVDVEWKKYSDENGLSSKKGLKRIIFEIVSWIDALVQAVFMVLLLNIFIVQLYEIPSESMVPEFLIRDRVVVFKTASGPKFPLSNIGLPYFKKYKRGDIVVFRNPHYSNDRKSEVRTFLSQLVYMCSLTTVNINVDEEGNPKADPLVKRVCGVPGEQLMMQDGNLYSRTKNNKEWKIVEKDNSYAEWNLNQTKYSVKKGIKEFPLRQKDFDLLVEIEQQRKDFDLNVFAVECDGLARQFETAFNLYKGHKEDNNLENFFNQENLFEYSLFAQHGTYAEKLLGSKNGAVWFRQFMTDWKSAGKIDFDGNLYDEASYKLNMMFKQLVGRLIVRDAQLISSGVTNDGLRNDSKNLETLEQAEKINFYAFLQDRRNMPVFPANDKDGKPQYIPSNCYFMMGDNRFNSLDMRHSYNEWLQPLTSYDKYSVTYLTNMAPQFVNRNRMLGTTSYRFWPVPRRGVPGHTGK